MTANQTARIRVLNDRLRHTYAGGRIMLTCGFASREPIFVLQALSAIRHFDEFDDTNDPYAEHDFGSVEIDEQVVFWKIDYYAPNFEDGASDPADEAKQSRSHAHHPALHDRL